MNKNGSIRKSAIRRFCGFTLLLSIIFASLISLIAFIVEDRVIANLLNVEIDHVQSNYERSQNLPEPLLPFIRYFSNLTSMQDTLPENVKEITGDGEIFVSGPTHYHVRKIELRKSNEAAQATSIYILAEVGPLLAVSQLSANIVVLVIIVGLLGISLAIWQAYKLANTTINPLTKLASAVQIKNDEQFGQSEIPLTKNEIEYVSNTVNHAFANLQKALLRESAFTRDVSHELRTPLTVFQNSLSLIEQRGWAPADFDKMQQAVQSMQFTIDTLLMLARNDSIACQPLQLRSLIEQTILNRYEELQSAGVEVDIKIDNQHVVSANADIFELILKSAITNVIQHASPCRLTISFAKDILQISNTVKDKTTEKVASTETFSHHNSGLGNSMVKRLAARMSWHVEFESKIDYYIVQLMPLSEGI